MAKPFDTDKPIIDQAEFNGITVWRTEGGRIEVSCDGFKSTKAALKDIAEKASIDVEDEWNTQYLGWHIIRKLNALNPHAKEIGKVSEVQEKITHDGLSEIKHILRLIMEARAESSLYTSDKNAISTIFKTISDKYSYDSILVKLTIIDSLYSTQMGRRYYGLDELARMLTAIHNGKTLAPSFCELASGAVTHDDKRFLVNNKNLFDECYGIGKDGKDKGKAISLISKYAYFETDGNFPIFDSIAREMYPKIWSYCGFSKKELPTQAELGGDIDKFVLAINTLRDKIGIESLTYDNIDRLLWTTGKIVRGNLSLVLTMEEYVLLKELDLLEEGSFNVGTADLSKLPFLKNKPLLDGFFNLAQKLIQL